jgi:protein TonB
MSNVSIYEKNWTDLVFEHRNKEYGAYQLRNENARTTMLAFFISLLLIFSLFGAWMLLSSFGTTPEDTLAEKPIERIVPVNLTDMPPPPPPPPLQPKSKVQTQAPKEPNLSNMVVAVTNDSEDVPKNEDLTNHPTIDSELPIGTNIEAPASTTATVFTPAVDTKKIRTTNELDRLPEYPGGMKKFYDYVGSSIEKSEINENLSSVSVIMGFVIEKDGSMSDIRVLRGSDKSLEKEAIRVLKSLRVKWSPGYLDGEKVRTQYTLPIKVAL